MRSGLRGIADADPEERFRRNAIAREALAIAIEAADPERMQRWIVEILRPSDAGDADGDVIKHRQLFSGWRAIRSSSFLISRFCSPWASAHSRIICCSVRICATRPWMASAQLDIAVAVRGLAPLSPRAAPSRSSAP